MQVSVVLTCMSDTEETSLYETAHHVDRSNGSSDLKTIRIGRSSLAQVI